MIELLAQATPSNGIYLDPNTLITGGFSVIVALIGIGWFSRRNVKQTEKVVKTAVNNHGSDEMEGLEAIRKEIELLRTAHASSNQLMVSIAQNMDTRLKLVEQRLEHVGLSETRGGYS